MNLIAAKKLAFDLLGNKNSHYWKEKGNKYYHGERVAKLVLELRRIILPDDDSHDEILTVAAWFHDLMNGSEDHAVRGANKTKELLHKYCTEDEINSICEIINVHDDRSSGRDTFSDYIKLHQDADQLDHFGTYDIWSGFTYAVAHGQTIDDVMNWLNNRQPSEYARYRRELNYEISRKIYDEKSEFLKEFTLRFRAESMGEIWKLDEIIAGGL